MINHAPRSTMCLPQPCVYRNHGPRGVATIATLRRYASRNIIAYYTTVSVMSWWLSWCGDGGGDKKERELHSCSYEKKKKVQVLRLNTESRAVCTVELSINKTPGRIHGRAYTSRGEDRKKTARAITRTFILRPLSNPSTPGMPFFLAFPKFIKRFLQTAATTTTKKSTMDTGDPHV